MYKILLVIFIAAVAVFFTLRDKKIPEIKEVILMSYQAMPNEDRIVDDANRSGLEVPLCSDFKTSQKLRSSIDRQKCYVCINMGIDYVGTSVHNFLCYNGITDQNEPPQKLCSVVLVKKDYK